MEGGVRCWVMVGGGWGTMLGDGGWRVGTMLGDGGWVEGGI